MKLSVIIVNYNVKHFLEQCLNSVYTAITNIDADVWVVDNNSVDGSCAMVKEKFPQVKLIENKDNPGFSIANNQAMRKSEAEYFLLLNPDTIVQEDTFSKCIDFMDANPEAGGLGVKMVDGRGKFLPESKRSLPTPMVSFYKIFGLSALFPKSKTFSKYHLGHLSENQTHEIEVLAGAYMFMRKSTLDKVGLLDETFFMYGEDIDLSYRIVKGGFKNYYFPETQILHYKGESTKKGSVNYVMVFYNAMIIFARKHFSKKNANIYSGLINTAIFFRAFIAILHRFFQKIIVPFSDAAIMYIGFLLATLFWQFIKYEDTTYSTTSFLIILPLYVLINLFILYISGVYDRSRSLKKIFTGAFSGILGLFVFYALLPEHLRFSRAVTLIGAAWLLTALPTYRIILEGLGLRIFKIRKSKKKRAAIIASDEEQARILQIINESNLKLDIAGIIHSNDKNTQGNFLGTIEQLEDIVKINKLDELIFGADDLSAQQIIQLMLKNAHLDLDYKIAPTGSNSIIGSNSINTSNDILFLHINSIDTEKNIRLKRITDITLSVFCITLLPLFLILRRGRKYLKNLPSVFLGKKTWYGYFPSENTNQLPKIKESILFPSANSTSNMAQIDALNLNYAKDYTPLKDINQFFIQLFN